MSKISDFVGADVFYLEKAMGQHTLHNVGSVVITDFCAAHVGIAIYKISCVLYMQRKNTFQLFYNMCSCEFQVLEPIEYFA